MLNIETKWLMDFLKLAEVKNFSKAANERNVTQSTFSRRIQALENAVGCKLFDRETTPITLTQSGGEFRTSARSLVVQLEYELGRLNDISVLGSQKVSIAAGHSIATDILPHFRFNIFAEEKQAILEVRATDVDHTLQMLQENACDIILSYKNLQHDVLPHIAHKLGESAIYCVTGCDQNGLPKYRLSEENLTPWIMHTTSSYMGRLTRELSAQYALKAVFSSSMTELVKELIVQGEGLGWLPEFAIKKELNSGQLVILKEERQTVTAELYAYRSTARLHSAGEHVWKKLCEYSAF